MGFIMTPGTFGTLYILAVKGVQGLERLNDEQNLRGLEAMGFVGKNFLSPQYPLAGKAADCPQVTPEGIYYLKTSIQRVKPYASRREMNN